MKIYQGVAGALVLSSMLNACGSGAAQLTTTAVGDLVALEMPNDRASSLRVSDGFKA